MQRNTTTAKTDKTVDRLLTTAETADILRIPTNTLEKWRVSGSGPRFTKVGFRVRYHPSDIAAYLAEQTRTSTSEAPA
jgi:predicted site-specific integrase-resolvase